MSRERKAVVVHQPALALWRRVVFVDWHGVLSMSPFWSTILSDRRHPLHQALRAKLGRLFGDTALMTEWMTGRLTTVEIVERLEITAGTRYTADQLRRHLERDCRSMRVNLDLIRALRAVRDRAFVVIATDNVDAFADTYRRLTGRRERRADPLTETPPPDSLAAWASSSDDLVCSSEVGALKADPQAFFGAYLRTCGLGFADALLIDDRTDNCAAFRAAGGLALRWTMHADPVTEVVRTLEGWLGAEPGQWPSSTSPSTPSSTPTRTSSAGIPPQATPAGGTSITLRTAPAVR